MFLGKIKNSNDKDCVKYMEFGGFECEHYFGGLSIYGASYSGYLIIIIWNIEIAQ